MHRFDEQSMLREANRKMQMYETRAALQHVLKEMKRSQSLRQRLAYTLFRLAEQLEPGKAVVPCEGAS